MKNLNLSGQTRWLRGVALAISNAKMRVNPRMTPTSTACDLGFTLLRMCAVFCILFTIGVGNVWGEEVTFTPSNCTSMNNTEGTQTQTLSSVTLSFYGVNNSSDLRTYKGKTLTITAPSGYNITNIVITCSVNGTGKGGPGCFGTGAPTGYTYEAEGPTGTWSGSAASVSFTTTDNQVRCESIVVTIAASTTYSVTWKSDGVTVHTDAAVPSGTTVSTPSDPSVPSGCTGAKFMGWTATENYSHATDAPGDLFKGTSPTINSAKTYYAVFADPN